MMNVDQKLSFRLWPASVWCQRTACTWCGCCPSTWWSLSQRFCSPSPVWSSHTARPHPQWNPLFRWINNREWLLRRSFTLFCLFKALYLMTSAFGNLITLVIVALFSAIGLEQVLNEWYLSKYRIINQALILFLRSPKFSPLWHWWRFLASS